jgi:hypothetical protein
MALDQMADAVSSWSRSETQRSVQKKVQTADPWPFARDASHPDVFLFAVPGGRSRFGRFDGYLSAPSKKLNTSIFQAVRIPGRVLVLQTEIQVEPQPLQVSPVPASRHRRLPHLSRKRFLEFRTETFHRKNPTVVYHYHGKEHKQAYSRQCGKTEGIWLDSMFLERDSQETIQQPGARETR